MITALQIKSYQTMSPDYAATELLKKQFSTLQKIRQPFYLTLEEFDQILHWKLISQYRRQEVIRKANTPEVIKAVTEAAFKIAHEDKDYEDELRISILCTLRGVGIPVASAIMALVYPDRYAVIDFRVWRVVFGEERNYFTLSDYKKYLHIVRGLAIDLGWTPQEIDLAIWAYDKFNH